MLVARGGRPGCLPMAVALAWVLGASAPSGRAIAQENADCLACHEDREATGTRLGKQVSVFVDPGVYAGSAHGQLGCIDCHTDLSGAELPHAEDLASADCATCHEDQAKEHAAGPHRGWVKDPSSPSGACVSCHGHHDVLRTGDAASPTHKSQASRLCGRCHPEPVANLSRSPHGTPATAPAAGCLDCHRTHAWVSPITPRTQVETCGACHPAQSTAHSRSLHGRAAGRGDPLAPGCRTCHDHHAIRSRKDPASPTSTMNIPSLCGRCHHEGTPVSLTHNIPQDRILENYSESIHGEGLFRKGLTVTAVCTSCHTSHDILEHDHPQSSINRNNVAATCTACHARIEQVHLKVIEGRLWEKEPHKIPSCVECHSPHKIRRRPLAPRGAANADCLKCHSDPKLTLERAGRIVSLYVDEEAFGLSMHGGTACAQCHTEVNVSLVRPCQAVRSPVDCGICHAARVEEHAASVHGRLAAQGDADAPGCLDCHESHTTQNHRVPASPTYPRNVPELCGRCHRQGEAAARRILMPVPDVVNSYVESIHGRGLVESGLVVSATCTDCHTTHGALPAADPKSSVHPSNVAATCGVCHHGIEEVFRKSIHGAGGGELELPTCEDCHTSHTITRTDAAGFRLKMMGQCGRCHRQEAETFFDTFHGKVSRLGAEGAAECYDCHGTHNILPTTDPHSTLSRQNVVATCAQCHPGAHRRFAGYLTHATHHDPTKYPYLFYAFWSMAALLAGTLTFAILHTLAWLWRLWRTREQWRPYKAAAAQRYYVRFDAIQRSMHLAMLLSFFTLSLTGMSLKFSYMGWAQALSTVLGGFESMGLLHRLAAVTLLGLFGFHLWQIRGMKRASGRSWLRFAFARDSMLFHWTDLVQVWQSIRWFFGRGPRPRYGRFTYWEKFDYFAVFWGVLVIGSTGLVLWFPELFTRVLPGWSVNVATIIHSDEALLAVAFIFTIHFFNTHFRPDKFPMDTVIFTGRVSLEELKHDKPAEYEALMASGTPEEIERTLMGPFPAALERGFRVFGFAALGLGLTLIALILYAMILGYR